MAHHRMPRLEQISHHLLGEARCLIEEIMWFMIALGGTMLVLLAAIKLGAHPIAAPLSVFAGVALWRLLERATTAGHDLAGWWIRHAR